MRVLGTVTLSVTIMIGGPIALSLSQDPDVQPIENRDAASAALSDGCFAKSYQETPPCEIAQ